MVPRIFKVLISISTLASILISASGLSRAEADGQLTFDNLDPITTSTTAYSNVNNYIDSLTTAAVKPTLHISTEAGRRDYSIYLQGIDRVSTLWSELVLPNKLNVVLHTEVDGEWADNKQIELTGEWLQRDSLPSLRMQKWGCNIGGMYLPGVLLFCVKSYKVPANTSEYIGEAHKFSHEYTHFMEMNVKNWMAHARGQGIGTRNPCWIEEGFATFYGLAVGSYSSDTAGQYRRQFVRELTYHYDDHRKDPHGTLAKLLVQGNVSETKRLFGMLENTPWPCDETENAYALGSLAAEALVAVKGQAGMVNFYKASARTGNWRQSFQEAFGITVDNFYEKLTPYLASQFDQTNFKYVSLTPSPTPTPTPTPTQPQTTDISSSISPNPSSSVLATVSTPKVNSQKRTILCIKGKSLKRVTAASPKCPKGYKLKK